MLNKSFARTAHAFVAMSLAASLAAPVASAQDDDGIISIEEIVVTAQKREQSLIDVPISVSAITAGEIDARGITNLIDAQYTIPGLTLSEFAPGQTRAQLRGVGTPGGSTGFAVVGFYLDEIPVNIGAAGALDVRLLDLERVEVLRGPQPTLYGEGSMGGTIRYITADPDHSGFYGRVAGRYGSVTDGSEAYLINGMLNMPIIDDTLSLRMVAGFENTGGWIDQISTGARDINDVEIQTFRGKLLYTPHDKLRLSFLYQHQQQDQDWQNFANSDTRETIGVFPGAIDESYDIFNLILSYDLGPATLLTTLGYTEREAVRVADVTGPFLNPVIEGTFGLPPGTVQAVGLFSDGGSELPSAEVRISSNGDGRFQYLFGVYHRDSENETLSFSEVVPDLSQTVPGYFDIFGGPPSIFGSEAYAVFFELGYDFTDKLNVSLGGRYYEDEQRQGGRTATFDTFNPRLNIAYDMDNGGLIFFNVAKGFRSGGFTAPVPPIFPVPPPPTYEPDELWSYEIGTKQVLLDRRLTAEIAVYYNEWEDIQGASIGFLPFNIIGNNGLASGPGVDIALTAAFTENLTGTLTYGYVGMEYDEPTAAAEKGDPLDLVSDESYSLSLDYNREVGWFGGADFSARADYQYTAGYTLILGQLFPPAPVTSTDSRSFLNLRAGLDFGNSEIYLYVENATDDKGVLYPEVASLPEPVITRPRVAGIGFSVDFGSE